MSVKKIIVLFSGNGTNLENIIKKLDKKNIDGTIFQISGAICNNKNAKGINICKKYNIPLTILEHQNYKNREDYDKELVKIINSYNPNLTVLAGFMRILTPVFTNNIKAINIHPSLLPLFKGVFAIKESFQSDMKVGGVTVHFVNNELDGGKIILQECFQKEENETLESFAQKIHLLEHKLLIQAIIKILNHPIKNSDTAPDFV